MVSFHGVQHRNWRIKLRKLGVLYSLHRARGIGHLVSAQDIDTDTQKAGYDIMLRIVSSICSGYWSLLSDVISCKNDSRSGFQRRAFPAIETPATCCTRSLQSFAKCVENTSKCHSRRLPSNFLEYLPSSLLLLLNTASSTAPDSDSDSYSSHHAPSPATTSSSPTPTPSPTPDSAPSDG